MFIVTVILSVINLRYTLTVISLNIVARNEIKIVEIMNKRQCDLSIIIPAYSEEKRIGPTLDQLAAFLLHEEFFRAKRVEVIVVAANSEDKTDEIVMGKTDLFGYLKLLKPGPHVGKGRDVQYGMLHANGKVTVFMDADLATPLYYLKDFYMACVSGTDMVIGTRNLLHYRSNKLRDLFSYFGNLLYRLASGIWIEDTQCGFKMFNTRARKLCFSKMTIMGWDFDIELLTIARLNKLSIKPMRIDDWKDMPYGTHNENVRGIARRTVRDFIRITLNRWKGMYI
jgi:dolichyl-phosphate beta-glucosyltransferase